MTKSIFKSWTIWFGILQIALGVVGALSGLMESTEAWTLIVTGFGTVGFRVKTSQPIV